MLSEEPEKKEAIEPEAAAAAPDKTESAKPLEEIFKDNRRHKGGYNKRHQSHKFFKGDRRDNKEHS